jgi:hypothetical protein
MEHKTFSTAVLMQTASFWDAPPCRSVEKCNHWWILIQRSGLAEGYTIWHCTILLDLTWPDQDLPLGIITFQKIALHTATWKWSQHIPCKMLVVIWWTTWHHNPNESNFDVKSWYNSGNASYGLAQNVTIKNSVFWNVMSRSLVEVYWLWSSKFLLNVSTLLPHCKVPIT